MNKLKRIRTILRFLVVLFFVAKAGYAVYNLLTLTYPFETTYTIYRLDHTLDVIYALLIAFLLWPD